jgi:hypothetical protein
MRSCSGQENTGSLCSDGDAKNILVASIPGKNPPAPDFSCVLTFIELIDHFGPYGGIMIRC